MESSKFSFNKLKEYGLATINNNDLEIEPFLDLITEMKKILKQINLLEKAFSDIDTKVSLVKLSKNKFDGFFDNSVLGLINFEISLNIHVLNGENSKDFKDLEDQYKNYESAARTILRLMRFIDFTLILFQQLVRHKEKSMSSILDFAYDKVFKKIFGIGGNIVANLALLISPSREEVLKILKGDTTLNNLDLYNAISNVLPEIEIVSATLEDFYEKNKLKDLP